MIFKETELKGVFVVELEKFEDERGFFARSWSAREFADRGLNPTSAEGNLSFNRRAGTLRGMHYQAAPHAQVKLVRCPRGTIFDVALDLRPHSPTFRRWVGVELSAENSRMLYIPEGFAHGFQTLTDDTEVCYQVSSSYAPDAGRGVRWDDPAFGIIWPEVAERTINERDRTYADFIV